jgi:hypothetical protein
MNVFIRRQILCSLASLSLLSPLVAYGEGTRKGSLFMSKQVVVDVVVFNYLDIPIFDVYLDGKMIGGSASLSESPYGQFSTVAGVSIPLGPQTLTWRDAGSGKTFTVKNAPTLTAEKIPPNARSLGVHIYPDNTAELIFSKDALEQSKRGLGYAKGFQKNGK